MKLALVLVLHCTLLTPQGRFFTHNELGYVGDVDRGSSVRNHWVHNDIGQIGVHLNSKERKIGIAFINYAVGSRFLIVLPRLVLVCSN